MLTIHGRYVSTTIALSMRVTREDLVGIHKSVRDMIKVFLNILEETHGLNPTTTTTNSSQTKVGISRLLIILYLFQNLFVRLFQTYLFQLIDLYFLRIYLFLHNHQKHQNEKPL